MSCTGFLDWPYELSAVVYFGTQLHVKGTKSSEKGFTTLMSIGMLPLMYVYELADSMFWHQVATIS